MCLRAPSAATVVTWISGAAMIVVDLTLLIERLAT